MITIIQDNELYIIRFPYNPDIVNMIKNVSGKAWHKEEKYWSIPKDKLGFLLNQFKNTIYEHQVKVYSNEALNVNSTLDQTSSADIPELDISQIRYYVADGLTPFKHQLDTVKYELDRKRRGLRSGFILADSMGCGKTSQVITLAMYDKNYEQAEHCLIICCVNSAKYTWLEEIEKHTNGEEHGYILGSRLKRNGDINYVGSGKNKYNDLCNGTMYGKHEPLPYFLIMNVEALRYKEGKFYVITKQLIDMVNTGKISMIALDEVHINISPKSLQGKLVLDIKKHIQKPVEWIPMTGTPIVNKPTDVFLPLRLIDGHRCDSYYLWNQEFCIYGGYGDHNIIGYKNIPKLKQLLQPNMLRRLKNKVLDLPPKVIIDEYVENTSYQQKLYAKTVDSIRTEKDLIKTALNPMTKFLKLRQVNGYPEAVDENLEVDKTYLSKNAKLTRLLELVDVIMENEEKVIIFSNWVEPLRTIYKFLKDRYVQQGIKTCVYTGTMNGDIREQQKHLFKTNPKCNIILGTIGALGVSHNLAEARNVIFYDEPWNLATMTQAEDRAYRGNSTESVTVHRLITKDTVDDVVHHILFKKQGMSEFIVDDVMDIHKHPELIDMMLK